MLKLTVVSIFFSVFALATEANATTVDVVYSGTIDAGNGSDNGNHFTVGQSTDLSGLGVSISYVFNVPNTAAQSSGVVSYFGGTLFPPDQSPAVSATVTINGKHVSFSGADYGSITESRDGSSGSGYQDHEAGSAGSDYAYSSVSIESGAPLNSVFGDFIYNTSSADTQFAYFELTDGTFGKFLPSSISQTVSAVPLPSGLPMFGTALIGLGIMAFVRRTAKNA